LVRHGGACKGETLVGHVAGLSCGLNTFGASSTASAKARTPEIVFRIGRAALEMNSSFERMRRDTLPCKEFSVEANPLASTRDIASGSHILKAQNAGIATLISDIIVAGVVPFFAFRST